MLAKILAWLRQPTTIGGLAGMAYGLVQLIQHKVTMETGLPLLVGSLVAVLIPDNTHAQAEAVQVATDAMGAASRTLLNTAATVARRTAPVLLLVSLGLWVTSCAGSSDVMVQGTSYAVTTVAGAEVALTAAEQIATAYVQLPLCPQPAGQLCSVASTSAQIKALAAKADADLALAKAGTATLAALVADISALAGALPAGTPIPKTT